MKTQKADTGVAKFIASVSNESQRADANALVALLTKATKSAPKMWGTSIIGFGSCILTYPNGRTLDWFPVGFSPRKGVTVLYGLTSYAGWEGDQKKLGKLGKGKTGKGCIYINKLADIDMKVLESNGKENR